MLPRARLTQVDTDTAYSLAAPAHLQPEERAVAKEQRIQVKLPI